MSTQERNSILAELSPPLAVHDPESWITPLIFSSPHSGRVYPRAFLEASRLAPASLRKSEDCYVDELFAPVVRLGAPLIEARFPRSYLDVNREPYELDPDLFQEALPEFANTRSLRVVGGLGTIARVVSDSEEIYRDRLPVAVAFERISRLYRPYHEALRSLIMTATRRFGIAILIDCHSMPSSTTGSNGQSRPDFVIGDRYGTACDGQLIRFLRGALREKGYDVSLNRPYAGGFITEHYGKPATGVHAVQLEVNRALYMNEETFERSPGFARLARDLERVIAGMIDAVPGLFRQRVAAE